MDDRNALATVLGTTPGRRIGSQPTENLRHASAFHDCPGAAVTNAVSATMTRLGFSGIPKSACLSSGSTIWFVGAGEPCMRAVAAALLPSSARTR
jgi:hypothetical protein